MQAAASPHTLRQRLVVVARWEHPAILLHCTTAIDHCSMLHPMSNRASDAMYAAQGSLRNHGLAGQGRCRRHRRAPPAVVAL